MLNDYLPCIITLPTGISHLVGLGGPRDDKIMGLTMTKTGGIPDTETVRRLQEVVDNSYYPMGRDIPIGILGIPHIS